MCVCERVCLNAKNVRFSFIVCEFNVVIIEQTNVVLGKQRDPLCVCAFLVIFGFFVTFFLFKFINLVCVLPNLHLSFTISLSDYVAYENR
jgi:hypothetical protein